MIEKTLRFCLTVSCCYCDFRRLNLPAVKTVFLLPIAVATACTAKPATSRTVDLILDSVATSSMLLGEIFVKYLCRKTYRMKRTDHIFSEHRGPTGLPSILLQAGLLHLQATVSVMPKLFRMRCGRIEGRGFSVCVGGFSPRLMRVMLFSLQLPLAFLLDPTKASSTMVFSTQIEGRKGITVGGRC